MSPIMFLLHGLLAAAASHIDGVAASQDLEIRINHIVKNVISR
jgi:hypothetical protein